MLDISSNRITPKSIEALCGLLDKNKTIEFIGIAKNDLKFEDISPLLDKFGRKPFPSETVDQHLKKMKERDMAIEKNKKAKPGAAKDLVPPVDSIIQEGTQWVLLQNDQFRHLNLCMNPISESARASIMAVMKRTRDEFSITLAGTEFSENSVHEMSEELSTDENPNLGTH